MWIPDLPACAGLASAKPKGPVVIHTEEDNGFARLPLAVVYRVLRQHEMAFEQCYLDSPNKPLCREAIVRVDFTIDKTGAVSASKPASAGDGELGSCAARAVSGLTFPEPEGGSVNIAMPIRFLH